MSRVNLGRPLRAETALDLYKLDAVAACDEKNIAMLLTGARHFRH